MKFQRRRRIPWIGWSYVARAVLTVFVEETVAIQQRAGGNVSLGGNVVHVLKGRPHPLRREKRLMTDVEANQAKLLFDASWPSLCGRWSWEKYERVGGVEFAHQVFVFGSIQNPPRYLDHDSAHFAWRRAFRIFAGRKYDVVVESLLSLFAVQAVLNNEIEHRFVHQDIEQGVVAILVDQWSGLERLIPARFANLQNDLSGAVQLFARTWDVSRSPRRF